MLDIGWQELLIVMVIAVVVIGPKDLPKVVRTIGQWTGKARGYARDFQRSIEGYADDSELSAIQKEIAEANKELKEARRDLDEEGQKINEDIAAAEHDLKTDMAAAGRAKAGEGPGNGTAATMDPGVAAPARVDVTAADPADPAEASEPAGQKSESRGEAT